MKEAISVIGLGYIGLPTSIFLAEAGYRVFGYDISQEKVHKINSGNIPFHENQLDSKLKSVISSGRFSASLKLQPADVYLITVPTPLSDSFAPEHTHVFNAVNDILNFLKKDDLLIIESTCAIGLTKEVMQRINRQRPDLFNTGKPLFCLAYCPERVLPGNMFYELEHNSRVIGGVNDHSSKTVAEFYRTFVKGEIDLVDSSTAEMIKLIENTYRDVNIAFANEVSEIAIHHGIEPYAAIRLANKHPRVNILNPGPGVGGHCIAIDPWFLISGASGMAQLSLLARQRNEYRPVQVVNKIMDFVESSNMGKDLLILGLAYKANSDDLRESPALRVIEGLSQRNVTVTVCDPAISKSDNFNFNVISEDSLMSSIPNFSHVVLLVNHSSFSSLKNTLEEHSSVLDFCGYF